LGKEDALESKKSTEKEVEIENAVGEKGAGEKEREDEHDIFDNGHAPGGGWPGRETSPERVSNLFRARVSKDVVESQDSGKKNERQRRDRQG
jgi:hypothetical protein